jgi:hypothetical protein
MVPWMKGSAGLFAIVAYGLFSITITTTLFGWEAWLGAGE